MTALTRPQARLLGVPAAVVAAIAFAWALAIAAQAAGDATKLHHSALIHSSLPAIAALLLFLIAWQAMIWIARPTVSNPLKPGGWHLVGWSRPSSPTSLRNACVCSRNSLNFCMTSSNCG